MSRGEFSLRAGLDRYRINKYIHKGQVMRSKTAWAIARAYQELYQEFFGKTISDQDAFDTMIEIVKEIRTPYLAAA